MKKEMYARTAEIFEAISNPEPQTWGIVATADDNARREALVADAALLLGNWTDAYQAVAMAAAARDERDMGVVFDAAEDLAAQEQAASRVTGVAL